MLDIRKEVAAIKEMYSAAASTKHFNAIVYGETGTGKTHLLRTCRRPVFVDSFDPGGSKTNRSVIEVDNPWMFVDTRWEMEDPLAPSVFEKWDAEYHRRKREGFFEHFGTYAVDSATTLAQAIMNVVLRKAGRLGGPPYQQDYLPAMALLERVVKDMTTLPCDVILTAHADADKDEVTGRMFIRPLFVGKLKVRVPLLFDEIYCATTKETSQGVNYQLLTRTTGLYQARTRIGSGKFDVYEPANILALLTKAGFSTEEKTWQTQE